MDQNQLGKEWQGQMQVLTSASEQTSRNAGLIAPHGGLLIDREASAAEQVELWASAARLQTLEVDARALADIECIATGVYSP